MKYITNPFVVGRLLKDVEAFSAGHRDEGVHPDPAAQAQLTQRIQILTLTTTTKKLFF